LVSQIGFGLSHCGFAKPVEKAALLSCVNNYSRFAG